MSAYLRKLGDLRQLDVIADDIAVEKRAADLIVQ